MRAISTDDVIDTSLKFKRNTSESTYKKKESENQSVVSETELFGILLGLIFARVL